MVCVPATQIPQRLLQERKEKKQLGRSWDRRVSTRPANMQASGRVRALLSFRVVWSFMLILNGILLLLLLPFRRRTINVSVEEKKETVVVRVPVAIVPRRQKETEAEARRALAIWRVGLRDEEGQEKSSRDFAIFTTERGDTLFTQSWAPVSVRTKGLVVLMHGLNEHSGRYNHFGKQLNESGLKVYAMDWIGHGGSDGLHGYVHSLEYAVNDLITFLDKILSENPELPCFCFGHSTGGAIVLKAALDSRIEARIKGVVLTSPAIRVQPSNPIVSAVAPIFSALVPRYQFRGAYKKGPPVCRDPEALKEKYSDPLVYTGPIRVRTGYEILRISNYLQCNLNRVSLPFLLLHGTADTVTDPAASRALYLRSSSPDKTITLYDGFLHDLLFEPEREHIAASIIQWLSSRLASPQRCNHTP